MTNETHSGTRAALQGALLLAAVGGVGALALLCVSLAHGNTRGAIVALALVGLLLCSGAVGGFVHHTTCRLRERGWSGAAASWSLAAGASLFVLMSFARILLPAAAFRGLDADRVAILTGWSALGYLALAALLFGLLMAHAATTDTAAPLLVPLHDTMPRGTALLWATTALVGWAVISLLAQETSLPLPESAGDARRILAAAQREALLRPHSEHVQMALALSLMRLHRFAEAQPVFERAERLDPRDAYPRNALGWTLNQQHRFAEAVPHLEEAIRIDSQYGDAHYNLGWAYLNLHRLPDAERSYRQVVRLMPDAAGAASEYGLILYRRNKTALAIQQVLRAARLEPRNPRHHATVAFLLRSQARFGEAKAQLDQALQLEPAAAGLWGELGVTEYLMHDAAAATAAFAEAARRDSAYFRQQPMALAMWHSAQRGRTGDVQVSQAGSHAALMNPKPQGR
jgi:Flp pilus assembly protein TadD